MARVQKDSATLVSSAGTGYFYVNRKNKRKFKGESKLKLKKYDPVTRKHVIFEEKKLSTLKKQTKPQKGKKATPEPEASGEVAPA